MRIQRSNGETTYKYVYTGGQLSQMTVGGDTLRFTYDADGTPLTVICNGTTYYYAANLQGDVVAILTSAGTAVVTYTYDAWGNILGTTDTTNFSLGTKNPLRYRGYVYDEETGLYYLQSRYYNPEWGRFLSAEPNYIWGEFDEGAGLLAYNLFAYCGNNPICRFDKNGEAWRLAFAGGIVFSSISFSSLGTGVATLVGSITPVGWVLLGVGAVGVTIWRGKLLYNNYKARQNAATTNAQALLNFASTAATPPPPNKGGKGTQTTSKTLYKKSGKNGFRIDVENPGNRQGQIHLQKGNAKYYYNVAQQEFRIGSSNGTLAPASIQRLLQDPNVIKAIAKGLLILGY